jgi:AraC family transcriptional regulator, regulatory protein of adaptative response / DNA-3-methyladenine glycosylase II
MRSLREPDAFPTSDLGLLRAMEKREQTMTKARLVELSEAWRPWRAYAAMYLWSADS